MSIAREQLRSDAEMELRARTATFTPRWGSFYLCGFMLLIGISLCAFLRQAWPIWFVIIGVIFTVIAVWRKLRESSILEAKEVAVATITSLKAQKGEDGTVWIAKYQFVAHDGRMYVGKGRSHRQLPREGECIPIVYRADDPVRNLPIFAFWCYRFDYVGIS